MTMDSLIDWTIPKNPVYLWTLPIFYANGWCYPWGIAAVGGTNVCLRKFQTPLIYSLIRDHGVTRMCGAPIVLNMLTASNERLKVLLAAGSLGFVVSHGYGMTEVAGVVVSCAWNPQWNRFPASEQARLKTRQGVKTIGFTEIYVMDMGSGQRVKRDGVTMGEIVMKGSSIMLGYLKDHVGTKKCLKDGWFFSGDIGVIFEDGYLEIKDRLKDVIISGGENVSSVEVETVLYMNMMVNEVAVVARPDDYWEETPCAFVSLKLGLNWKPKEDELIIEYCRDKMPRYMVPKTVLFVDELPKSSTGKICKFVLKVIASKMGSTKLSRMNMSVVERNTKENIEENSLRKSLCFVDEGESKAVFFQVI